MSNQRTNRVFASPSDYPLAAANSAAHNQQTSHNIHMEIMTSINNISLWFAQLDPVQDPFTANILPERIENAFFLLQLVHEYTNHEPLAHHEKYSVWWFLWHLIRVLILYMPGSQFAVGVALTYGRLLAVT